MDFVAGGLVRAVGQQAISWLTAQSNKWWKSQVHRARSRVLLSIVGAVLLVLLIGATLVWQLMPLLARPSDFMMIFATVAAIAMGLAAYADWQWILLALIGVLRVVSGAIIPSGRILAVGIAGWHTQFNGDGGLASPRGAYEAQVAGHAVLLLVSTLWGQKLFRLSNDRLGGRRAVFRLSIELLLMSVLRSLDAQRGDLGAGDVRRFLTLLLHAFLILGWTSLTDLAVLLTGCVSWEGATSWEDIAGFLPGIVQIYEFRNNIPSANFCRVLAAVRLCAPIAVLLFWVCGAALGALGALPALLVCISCVLVAAAEVDQTKRMLCQKDSSPSCFMCMAYLTGVTGFEELGCRLEKVLGTLTALPANFVDFAKQLFKASRRLRASDETPPAAAPAQALAAAVPDATLPPPNPAREKLEANFKNVDIFGEDDILIAFFGGTGSGKSSVIKALLGNEHADFDGILVGNAAGTTSCPLAIEWRVAPGGQKVWLVDVPGHGQPTRLGRGLQQASGSVMEDAEVVTQDCNDEADRIQAEIQRVYPRVHLAVTVIRGMQPQRPLQEWNDHVRERFPGKRHVVLFNGQREDPTAKQWSPSVFEQEFDKLKKTYTGPLSAGDEHSVDWYCDVPGYDFRTDPTLVEAIRGRQNLTDVKEKLVAFADECGPEAVAEVASDKQMDEVVQVLKETSWSSAVGGAVAGGVAVAAGPALGVAAGMGVAFYMLSGTLRGKMAAASAEVVEDTSTPPLVEGTETPQVAEETTCPAVVKGTSSLEVLGECLQKHTEVATDAS